jgi:hypothetical protein
MLLYTSIIHKVETVWWLKKMNNIKKLFYVFKSGGTEIKGDTSAVGLCWWCEFSGLYYRYHKEKTETLIDASKEVGDHLCGLVVRVPGYRSRGPEFDSLRYQIFWEVVGLERGPRSLMSIIEELLEWKSSGSGSRKPRLTAVGIRCADHATLSIRTVGTNFADKWRSPGRYSSPAD